MSDTKKIKHDILPLFFHTAEFFPQPSANEENI